MRGEVLTPRARGGIQTLTTFRRHREKALGCQAAVDHLFSTPWQLPRTVMPYTLEDTSSLQPPSLDKICASYALIEGRLASSWPQHSYNQDANRGTAVHFHMTGVGFVVSAPPPGRVHIFVWIGEAEAGRTDGLQRL